MAGVKAGRGAARARRERERERERERGGAASSAEPTYRDFSWLRHTFVAFLRYYGNDVTVATLISAHFDQKAVVIRWIIPD